jgi:hypothetical protein
MWFFLHQKGSGTAWVRARLCKLQNRVHSTRTFFQFVSELPEFKPIFVPLEGKLLPRIYIVERIRISYFLALSRVARFYATTEQKLIHSFGNALRFRRKNQPITPKFVLIMKYIHPPPHWYRKNKNKFIPTYSSSKTVTSKQLQTTQYK